MVEQNSFEPVWRVCHNKEFTVTGFHSDNVCTVSRGKLRSLWIATSTAYLAFHVLYYMNFVISNIFIYYFCYFNYFNVIFKILLLNFIILLILLFLFSMLQALWGVHQHHHLHLRGPSVSTIHDVKVFQKQKKKVCRLEKEGISGSVSEFLLNLFYRLALCGQPPPRMIMLGLIFHKFKHGSNSIHFKVYLLCIWITLK